MTINKIIGLNAATIMLVACVPTQPSPIFTLAQYNDLETGMTVEKVKEVMGAEPSTVSESGEWVTMIFSNSNGTNAVVMFQNGKLQSKSQTGLK